MLNRSAGQLVRQAVTIATPVLNTTVATPPCCVPNTGSSAGGEQVVLNGVGLSGVTAVTFGGIAALNPINLSDTQILVTTPPVSPGTWSVVVTCSAGKSATRAAAFTHVAP